jgi:N utilization substance protein B
VSELGAQRHRARERALELLYEIDMKAQPAQVVLASLSLAPDPYTMTLIDGVSANGEQIKDLISKFSTDWTFDRIALVDRLIMSIAVTELLLPEPPPLAVVLDEAIEMAKTFSSEGAPSYINGVLAAIAASLAG